MWNYEHNKQTFHLPSLQLPVVCSYQVVDYELVIWENGPQNGKDNTFLIRRNGTCMENCSQKEILLDSVSFMLDRPYWIKVVVFTDAGDTSSAPQQFSKFL